MNDYSKLLKNKLSIITGCNRGIGKAILKIFAEQGSNIIACVRKKNLIFTDFINKISNQYNIEITPLYFDLTNLEEMKTELHIVTKRKMDIDILINNAGAINTALFQMTTKDNINQMFDVNYFGTFFLTQFISKIMIRKKIGNIINISSSAAIEFNIGRSAYASSKAALIASSNVMSKELSNYNIRVNTIAPGLTDTDLMRESTTPEIIEKTKQRISLKRLGMPKEIANVALFLASDMSSYITGQVVKVDGGLHEG